MLFQIGKEEKFCTNCKYFYAHYVKCGNHFEQLRAGHCSFLKHKIREGFQTCKNFKPIEEEPFMAKRFEEVK